MAASVSAGNIVSISAEKQQASYAVLTTVADHSLVS